MPSMSYSILSGSNCRIYDDRVHEASPYVPKAICLESGTSGTPRSSRAYGCILGLIGRQKTSGGVDISFWLRGKDLNLRPLGYEPNELPDCSTPHNYRSVTSVSRATKSGGFVVAQQFCHPSLWDCRFLKIDGNVKVWVNRGMN